MQVLRIFFCDWKLYVAYKHDNFMFHICTCILVNARYIICFNIYKYYYTHTYSYDPKSSNLLHCLLQWNCYAKCWAFALAFNGCIATLLEDMCDYSRLKVLSLCKNSPDSVKSVYGYCAVGVRNTCWYK